MTDIRRADIFAVVSLIVATAMFAKYFVDFGIPPFEDAAMLMRYAGHLAQGEGIVWNIGEAPVDGATDFLFMVVVGLLHYLGATLESAVRLITISSHFGAVVLIYLGIRHYQNSQIVPAFLSAAYFAVGPGLFLSAAYFGTAFFTLFVLISWLLAQRLIFSPATRSNASYLAFSLACLITGLIRPEGVLISIFMIAAISMLMPSRDTRQLALVFGGIFLILGGAYFLWRWSYFGHPLPNPFYKKSADFLYPSSLQASIVNSTQLMFPFIIALLLALRSQQTIRIATAFLIPILGSVSMWVLISNEMNFGARFQYPILAIAVVSWAPLVKPLCSFSSLPPFMVSSTVRKTATLLVTTSLVAIIFIQHIHRSTGIRYSLDGRHDVAIMLSEYADHGYTIATTEAGLLPFYSRWRAVDTWGLNDPWIAHNGPITENYLAQQNPDVIVWHGFFSPLHPESVKRGDPLWSDQVETLRSFAEKRGYTLASAYGLKPTDTHYYYVRPGLAEHDEIVERIRAMDYRWFWNGKLATDYSRLN